MKLPSREECEELFRQYKVPGNIREHCERVAEVAVFIAKNMDIDVNIDHVERLALLHDLMKHVTLKELKEAPEFKAPKPTQEEIAMHQKLRKKYAGMHETDIAYELLKEEYPEFAESIRKESKFGDKTWEEKIVGYVDYIVFLTDIIGLEARFSDLEKRYSKLTAEKIERWKKVKQEKRKIEKEIFEHLPFRPEKLTERI